MKELKYKAWWAGQFLKEVYLETDLLLCVALQVVTTVYVTKLKQGKNIVNP